VPVAIYDDFHSVGVIGFRRVQSGHQCDYVGVLEPRGCNCLINDRGFNHGFVALNVDDKGIGTEGIGGLS
jgi:hypothetical protein